MNTNLAPQNKDFKSTCLKNIIKKKINNQKLLRNILITYNKFLGETKKLSFSELKKNIGEKCIILLETSEIHLQEFVY